MKTRKISYASYNRNSAFWMDQLSNGTDVIVTRAGKVVMHLYGEPVQYVETSAEMLRRNKITVYPTRKAA